MASVSRIISRGYASATSAAIRPPIQITTLSGTYATSTYLAALKKSKKELDSVAKTMAELQAKLEGDASIGKVLNNPTLTVSQRSELINSLVPSNSSPIITNLLTVLGDNTRLPTFPSICADFSSLMSAHNGELLITVTTAEPLSSSSKEFKRLETALKGSEIAKGKQVKIVNKVNEAVIGGLMVDFGDKTIDLTASGKVRRMGAAIAESV